jgi:hypothetical protein
MRRGLPVAHELGARAQRGHSDKLFRRTSGDASLTPAGAAAIIAE